MHKPIKPYNMKKLFTIGLLTIILAALTACSDDEPGRKESKPILLSSAEQEIVNQQNDFSLNMMEKIMDTGDYKENNFMVSPLSISMCMSMLANGAQGETRDEIINTLGFEGMSLER